MKMVDVDIEKLYEGISGVNLSCYKKFHELEDRIIVLERKVARLEQFSPLDTNGHEY